MQPTHVQLFGPSYLRTVWTADFEAYKADGVDAKVLELLRRWSERAVVKERKTTSPFVATLFVDLWGYTQTGRGVAAEGFTCDAEHAVYGAGAGGSTGSADVALGWFGRSDVAAVPQVLCELKDVRSGLDQLLTPA